MLRFAIAVFALGLFAAPAWANSGIGFLIPSLPALIIALVPVIFIEAPVLSAVLRLPIQAGLRLSAAINVRSTLFGIVIALLVDIALMASSGAMGHAPSRAIALVSLVPMFFVTWWIERRAVTRRLAEQSMTRAVLATLAANVLSYGVLVSAIAWHPFFKFYDQMGYRERIYGHIFRANDWKEGVDQYWQTHKRFPERAADIGLENSPANRGMPADPQRTGVPIVTLEPRGRLVFELYFPYDPEIDRKRLIYEPRLSGAKLDWQCYTPDLPLQYAPSGCRDKAN